MEEHKILSNFKFCKKFKKYKRAAGQMEDCLKYDCGPVCEMNLLFKSLKLQVITEKNEKECSAELFNFYKSFSKEGNPYSEWMRVLQNCLRENI